MDNTGFAVDIRPDAVVPKPICIFMKTAIITVITGQDGAYLSQLLLEKGYRVYGTCRQFKEVDYWRLQELGIQTYPQLKYDLTDPEASMVPLQKVQSDEIYNLATQGFLVEGGATQCESGGYRAYCHHHALAVANAPRWIQGGA